MEIRNYTCPIVWWRGALFSRLMFQTLYCFSYIFYMGFPHFTSFSEISIEALSNIACIYNNSTIYFFFPFFFWNHRDFIYKMKNKQRCSWNPWNHCLSESKNNWLLIENIVQAWSRHFESLIFWIGVHIFFFKKNCFSKLFITSIGILKLLKKLTSLHPR